MKIKYSISKYTIFMLNIVYLPLIICHLAMPMHIYCLLPEISNLYYLFAILLIVLLTIPTVFSGFILEMNNTYSLKKKIIIFFSMLIGYFALSQYLINYRINRHLEKHGTHLTGIVFRKINKGSYFRYGIEFEINNLKHRTYVDDDSENSLVDSLLEFPILVSVKDPRICKPDL